MVQVPFTDKVRVKSTEGRVNKKKIKAESDHMPNKLCDGMPR